jgi:hypothetical protein
MVLRSGIVEESKVNAAIDIVLRQLAPDVKRIRYDFEQDWSGDDAIFYRILISDDAARMRLRETVRNAVSMLESHLNLETMGLRVYHNVRTESEQAALREKSWE